ncbi:MAG: chemotaxis protein CheC [Methanosarcinales archaeon]|nr:chemotaxis protein CheC [Methanosarcinales archaeon]
MDIILDNFHYDALNEVGNIGMGNATTALSQLVGKGVRVSIPSLMVVDTQNIIDKTEDIDVVGIIIKVVGDISGGNMLLFKKSHAESLADILLLDTAYEDDEEMRLSVINEVANILVGSYFNALSKFLDLNVLPSIPYQTQGSTSDIFKLADTRLSCNIDHILALTTMFEIDTASSYQTVDGDMFMMLDSVSINTILDRIDRMRST